MKPLAASALTYLLLAYSVYFGWDSILPISRSVASSLSHPRTFLSRLETPGAGEDALPWISVESAHLLARYGISEYSITPSIGPHEFAHQQIVAEAWPRKYEPGARYQLVTPAEKVPVNCTVLASGKEIRLLDCPR